MLKLFVIDCAVIFPNNIMFKLWNKIDIVIYLVRHIILDNPRKLIVTNLYAIPNRTKTKTTHHHHKCAPKRIILNK